MKWFLINLGRVLVLLPVILLFLLIEVEDGDTKVFIEAGGLKYLFIGVIIFFSVLIGLEHVLSKIIKLKITSSVRDYCTHLVLPVYLMWMMVLTLFIYQILAGSYLAYGVWNRGISKANNLFYKMSNSQFSRTEKDLTKSIFVSKEHFTEELRNYTNEKNKKFLILKDCVLNDKPND